MLLHCHTMDAALLSEEEYKSMICGGGKFREPQANKISITT